MMAVAIGFNGFLKSDCTKVIAINARASAANAWSDPAARGQFA